MMKMSEQKIIKSGTDYRTLNRNQKQMQADKRDMVQRTVYKNKNE